MPTIWITGAHGQLARALVRSTPAEYHCRCFGRDQWDLSQPDVLSLPSKGLPDLLIHTAAMTDVDGAEQHREAAFKLNAESSEALARWCASHDIPLLGISTDYVFDGQACKPYTEQDEVNPMSVYGQSKRAGEQAIFEHLGQQGAVVRTTWLYDAQGKNFLTTMLRLMGQGVSPLRIVADQWGAPTSCHALAELLWLLADDMITTQNGGGLYHWSCAGQTNWYEFAQTIQDRALELALISKPVTIESTTAAEYGAPAPRPAFSVLDSSALSNRLGQKATPPTWEKALGAVMQELQQMNKG
ncbi:dTDP-4-dehydrorhamnose reductase [Magnetococcus sp. PR-3]|uniref:dTDP-4-dehydrorhamnose reductase n=1 Tax=Magnetococcus sp. PR-3 TaxID=3120355 RepID=UPI002FCDEA90